MRGTVEAVHLSGGHTFTKRQAASIELVAGVGVVGDAHAGATVKHRSRVAADPSRPNLRQVHLIHAELLDEAAAAGIEVPHGGLGENVTTRGIDLLALPTGTLVRLGDEALVAITGLRNPCHQIEDYRPGLLAMLLRRRDDGTIERRAGVMAVVLAGGMVRAGDAIAVVLPPEPYRTLEKV